jgi:O-antigen ligase
LFPKYPVQQIAKVYLSFSVFLFLALSVSFKGSYALSGSILLSSYLFLFSTTIRQRIALTSTEKVLLAMLLLYLISVILEVVLYGEKIRVIDPESKILLFIPLIFMLNAVRVPSLVVVFGFGAGALGIFLLAIYEKYYLGVDRVGTFINAIQLGNLALCLAMMAILLSPIGFNNKKNGMLLGCSLIFLGLLGVIAAVFTLTRGGLLFLPLLLVIVAIYYFQVLKRQKRKVLIGLSLFALVLVIAVPQTSAVARFKEAIDNVKSYYEQGNASTSTGIRLELWKTASLIALDHPVFGVGHSQYLVEKENLIKQGVISRDILTYDHSHNAYLDALVRRGSLGLLVLLALLLFPVYIGHRLAKSSDQASKVTGVGLLVFGLFFMLANITQVFFAHNSGIVMYSGLLIILVSLCLSEQVTETVDDS